MMKLREVAVKMMKLRETLPHTVAPVYGCRRFGIALSFGPVVAGASRQLTCKEARGLTTYTCRSVDPR